MAARKKNQTKAMLEIVAEVQADASPGFEWVEWPRPIRNGEWVDREGLTWKLRGRLDARKAKRMMGREDISVVYAYDLQVNRLEDNDRSVLILRVQEFIRGESPGRTDFEFAEFRNVQGCQMVVVEESC